MSNESIKIYSDTVVRQTILQGMENERTYPGEFLMGELAFTRDTGRVFVGTFTNNKQEKDCEETPGGLIVGNKFHGCIDESSSTENIFVSSNISGTNYYTGDFYFDNTDKKELVIVNGNKEEDYIKITSYDVLDENGVLITDKSENSTKKILKTNKEAIEKIVSNQAEKGIDNITIKDTCKLPSSLFYDGKEISLSFPINENQSEFVMTLVTNTTKDEEGNIVKTIYSYEPKSFTDFFKEGYVSLESDQENPGIIVSNRTDSTGSGFAYKIGLDMNNFKELLSQVTNEQPTTSQINHSSQSRGLFYLSYLKSIPFTNNIIEKSIKEIELNEEDGSTIPYSAQSVILQITSKADTVTRIRHLKSNGVLLLELPENSNTQITTVEVPLIENNDMNDKKFIIHSTSNPTVKLLGYRI